MASSKATPAHSPGQGDRRARRLQVGQHQARNRLVAERVEPLGGISAARGRSSPPPQRRQALEPLADLPAIPAGAGLGHAGVEQLLARLQLRLRQVLGHGRVPLPAVVVDLGRDGRGDGQAASSASPPRCWRRPARGSACTSARIARAPGSAATGSAGSRGTGSVPRPARRPRRSRSAGSFASALSTSVSRSRGIRRSCSRNGRGGSCAILSSSDAWSCAAKAGRRVSIS